jgi:hypothetical protein
MRHPLERIVMRLFGHRHKWQPYKLIGNKGSTLFYCRHCDCGEDQIHNAGPAGNGKWQDRSKPLRNEFEREWLADAKPYNTSLTGDSPVQATVMQQQR